jgi:DNA adenine methylase
VKPFLKWAGGKRWIVDRNEFRIPPYTGRYIEPFLGSGAVFFHLAPKHAALSDTNHRLIEAYQEVRSSWSSVFAELIRHQTLHSPDHYYDQRGMEYDNPVERAAQFIYLNRT